MARSPRTDPVAATAFTARLLGTAQDGGLPQFGCRCANCERARREPHRRRTPASLLLTDVTSGFRLLIDPTPELARQYDALLADEAELDARREQSAADRPGPFDAVALTHVHWGHWIGLGLFGREVSAAERLPVHVTDSVARFLSNNAPTRLAVDLGHLDLRVFRQGDSVEVGPFRLCPVGVEHRSETADTVCFRVTHEAASDGLLYCPDIDRWPPPGGRPALAELACECRLALVDATFGAPDELPGRNLAEIPHPMVGETTAVFAPAVEKGVTVALIHLNHSNVAADPDSEVARRATAAGFVIPRDGHTFEL
jgi:pyrroloquinoline quinone biosynthesis protein B